jgi:hypothetical protein
LFTVVSLFDRRRARFFKFWDKLTSRLRIKRRRRYLAEIMGNYSLKARSFARIKLFIYNAERAQRIVGNFDRKGRLQKLGGFHLREYSRKSRLRKYYHRYDFVWSLARQRVVLTVVHKAGCVWGTCAMLI